MRTRIAVILLLVGLPAIPAHAQPGELEAKQLEAEVLRAELREHGRRLSMADEDHNEARYRRERVSAQLAAIRGKVAVAEERWREHKERLGQRARSLYMYPGAAIEAWLGMRTLGEASRAAVLSASVLGDDGELIAATQSARRELEREAEGLASVRAQAERVEADVAAKRVVLQERAAEQRSLLGRAEGEIAAIIETQRQAEVEAARRAAAEALADAQPAEGAAEEPAEEPAEEVAEEPAEEAARAPDPAEHAEPAVPSANRPAAAEAVRTARQQIGKPYEWGASGPGSFDCSGLTAYAWAAAGVQLPHSSRAQYASLPKVPRSSLQPGDLLFFGSPIHHVGIYEGGGVMINSPETGETVRRNSIARSDFVGAARPG